MGTKKQKHQVQPKNQTRKHKYRRRTRARSGFHKQHKHPGENFYLYINQSWLEKTKIPPTKVVYGVSEEIEKKIDMQTKEILKDCIAQADKQGSIESMLGKLTLSVQSANEQTKALSLVQRILANIQSITSKEEIAVVLGEFTRYKIRNVFHLYGQYENKHRKEYTFTLGIGTLGLPDATFYEKRSLNRGKAYRSYKILLKRLGYLFGIPTLPSIVKLEHLLAKVIIQAEQDTIEYERKGNELQKEFEHVPFDTLFQTIGLSDWKQETFFVESLRWLHTLNKLFHHVGLDQWRLLLSLHFILYSISWLPPHYSDLSFQFYRKQLKGQKQKMTREEQSIYVAQQYATPFFSRLYKERCIDLSIKPKIEHMVEDLLHFAKQRLETIEWLEPKTRKKAQEKVEAMRYIVGYPEEFEHHKIPVLDKDNILYNLLTLGDWQTRYEIGKLGQPITKRKEWDDAIFVVNAYYYEQANEMVIPAGILQSPFYDKEKSIAWNYGGIGSILCHELTHAFDKEGKEYDPEGFQKKWWTSTDNRKYNEKTKALISLYDKQRVLGLPVSGRKTLSENIADIGGMGIALDALKEKIGSMRLTEEERKNLYKEFFISYAVSWRLKENKKKQIQSLITDKHAPPSLRVNLVVSQFEEWYTAFDIQPSDALYLPPEKRIRIF